MKQFFAVCLIALAGAAYAVDVPSSFGIYGKTFRVSGGVHASYGAGATMQCYIYTDEKNVPEYITCFDWIGGEFVPGPGCFVDADTAVECDIQDHPINAVDIRFADNATLNGLEWTGDALPTVMKVTVEGSHGADNFGTGPRPGFLQQFFPNVLTVAYTKKKGTWLISW